MLERTPTQTLLGTGAFLLPSVASASSSTHTLKFISVTLDTNGGFLYEGPGY